MSYRDLILSLKKRSLQTCNALGGLLQGIRKLRDLDLVLHRLVLELRLQLLNPLLELGRRGEKRDEDEQRSVSSTNSLPSPSSVNATVSYSPPIC